ncbi:hypothetical protein [Halalkalibacter akibai]|uniref:SurA N-terminal domain-containing protein n=1 Tax=Halalkalibacter akibai (strain ATCC 43226 / DSM 21942 / CIP 109018 / JCM 9157 / 1139) TaxID=1236973 RepID=W4QZT8_HALA3|nr:hypothetical protein [Halalkalibacter akibai]GAE37183.1 hypothetical protein JCM9157_4451 [Halalkalibacter akibai JCM 9157]
MKLLLLILVLTVSVACSSDGAKEKSFTAVKDEDVVAVVKGKEITLKDIRSLYFVDNQDIPIMVEKFVQEEIMVLEAKSTGNDVSEELDSMELLFPLDNSGNEDFFESQADYLGITVEEYYEEYFKERIERDAYVNHLINERLDISNYRVDELEVMDKEINDFISTLWDKYEEDIEILL